MRIAIDCVHYPISKNLASHRASWAKYWKYYLQSKGNDVEILYRNDHHRWSEFDAIYLYHGMEFNGALNLAGGVGEWHIQRFNDFADFMNDPSYNNIKVYSIDHVMPDYYELLQKRKIDIPKLYGVTDNISTVKLPDNSHQVVIGDSHSLSAMMPISDEFVRVFRNDFKTLNGAITDGFDTYGDLSEAHTATFYFGNIDARHHALRHYVSPTEAAASYVERYYEEVRRVKKLYPNLNNIEIIGLLPMTPDNRRLPKSGYYKGEPFYGSLEDRIEFIDMFNYMMSKTCLNMDWNFFVWPSEFHNEDKTLNVTYMEKPQSVHMSQAAYRYDLEKNEARYV